METKKNYTLPIIMMFFLFGMIAFVTNLAAPMGVVLKSQFHLSNAMGLLGNAANFIAYAIMGIPGGILLQKVGYKKTALIAIAVGFIGVLIQYFSGIASQSSAMIIYLLGAFVAGFSMCLLNTVVNPMLNTLGGGGNKGNQLILTGDTLNAVMATVTPALVGILIGEVTKETNITDTFPVMYIAMGVFALLFFLLLVISIPEPQEQWSSEPIGKLISGALKFRHLVLGIIAVFVYMGIEVGPPGVMFLWLSELPSVGATIAGSVAATYWFLMLIGRMCGAAVGSKVSSKVMLSVCSFVALILTVAAIISPSSVLVSLPVFKTSELGALSFGLAQVPINAMFLVLIGLCTSIMWGATFNLAVEGLGKYTAVASGLFMTMVCGGGILPLLQGWAADKFDYLSSYWILFALCVYMLFYALVGSKNVNKDIKVD